MSTAVVSPGESAQSAVTYLSKSGTSFDSRFTLKILRNLPTIRKQVDATNLATLIAEHYDETYAKTILDLANLDYSGEFGQSVPISPEVDAFLHLLVQVWAINEDGVDTEKLMRLGQLSVKHLADSYNRRSLDHFNSKIWFYYVRAAELSKNLFSRELYSEMMTAYRTACLRHDFETQSMLITLLLRVLIFTNQIGTASDLVAKTTFPEGNASNSLAARYHYYLSRINAVELDYGTAYEQITAAIRKSPHTPAATGFLQTANKLSVLIELLTGDIPARRAFGSREQPELIAPLQPYFALAKAVRAGDVNQFQNALKTHEAALKKDGNLALARRLRQNVIKTGIRVISLTYSKIPLKDICLKLCLDSEESAEYMVAKAIRDGVIDATINHQKGYMQSLDSSNVYASTDPQECFDERIKFCMSLHDDNVKSLRYLSSDLKDDLRDLQEAREREKELVSEMQDTSDLDDDDMDFDF